MSCRNVLRTVLAAAVGLTLTTHADAKLEAVPAETDTQFALNMYKQLAKSEGNLFFSPFSIQAALAMTAAGARGETAAEMHKALDLPEGGAHQRMAGNIEKLTVPPKDEVAGRFRLEIANALWGQQRYPFNEAFLKLTRESYKAEAQSLDFSQPDAARKTINDWVANKTQDKIKDLLGEGTVTPDTRLVLTNAVYFKADWASKFEKEATSDQPFFVSPEKPQNIPMMQQSERFPYAETDKLQAVAMGYAGGTAQMYILVPKTPDGLAKLESELDAKSLDALFKSTARRMVNLSMPRFSFEFATSLRKPLEAMGMKQAFDFEKADFSGMATGEKLAITDALHKAFVKVDENGTEAAAATAVAIGALSAMEPQEPVIVKADRPFMVVIRHRESGSILFMGRVAKPEGAK